MDKQSQKKNQRKRAFLAAIAMLLVSAIVLTTASFAWFTLGRSAQVDELDLKVTKQGEGIAISANTSEFTDTLTFADLKGTAQSNYKAISEDYNYFPDRISPNSTVFGLNTMPAFFAGGIDKALGKMAATASTSANGTQIYRGDGKAAIPSDGKAAGFYAFDIFIKNGGDAAVNVKMSDSKIKVDADVAKKDTNEDKGDAAYYEAAAKSMRIGFVKCSSATASGYVGDGSAVSGAAAAIFSGNTATTNPIDAAGEYDIADGAYTVASSKTYGCSVDDGSKDVTISLDPGVNKIRVYIWMEGQDTNCTDELASQFIAANIVFSLV